MIFTPEHVRLILELPVQLKTQTRRLEQPGDVPLSKAGGQYYGLERGGRTIYKVDGRLVGVDWYSGAGTRTSGALGGGSATYRQPTYGVQAGRGEVSLGRFRITGIRWEWLQDISEVDAVAEGVANLHPRQAFAALWDSIHRKRGTRWNDNPGVWVLNIERLYYDEELGYQPLGQGAVGLGAAPLEALERRIEAAITAIEAEDDPDVGKPWLVEHVLALLRGDATQEADDD